jgi:hypothetical protein
MDPLDSGWTSRPPPRPREMHPAEFYCLAGCVTFIIAAFVLTTGFRGVFEAYF